MGRTVEGIREHGVVAVVDAPVEAQLLDWAKAVAKGGVRILGVPVTLPTVTELVDDLADEADLLVGVIDLISKDQVSIALASGAAFVFSPIADPELISACKDRGIDVIAGAATPTEIMRARDAGADVIAVHPVGAMGGEAYFAVLARQFRDVPLVGSGAVDLENATGMLEAGALGVIVDRGVFPEPNEPAALEVITARALALTEVCHDAMGAPKRESMTDVLGHSAAAEEPDAPAEQPAAEEPRAAAEQPEPPAAPATPPPTPPAAAATPPPTPPAESPPAPSAEPAAEAAAAEPSELGGLSDLLEPEDGSDPLAEGAQPLGEQDVLQNENAPAEADEGEFESFVEPE